MNRIVINVIMNDGSILTQECVPNNINGQFTNKDKNNAYKWQALLSKDLDVYRVDVNIT